MIYAGDPLPDFTFSYSGFAYDDDELIVFGPDGPGYTLNPDFLGAAGCYQIIPDGSATNYTITAVPGTLYVNPSGAGSFAVRPILRCIEEVLWHPSGYLYVAHFEYQNKNATVVYVPIGEDNLLIAEGPFEAVDQPVLFYPGGGSFDVFFNGDKLIWRIASLESGRKTSVASEASSSSARCKKGVKKSHSGISGDEFLDTDQVFGAYPNPVSDKLLIRLEDETMPGLIRVMDLSGRLYNIQTVFKGMHLLELDMSDLESGLYLISLDTGESKTIFRVMKK